MDVVFFGVFRPIARMLPTFRRLSLRVIVVVSLWLFARTGSLVVLRMTWLYKFFEFWLNSSL